MYNVVGDAQVLRNPAAQQMNDPCRSGFGRRGISEVETCFQNAKPAFAKKTLQRAIESIFSLFGSDALVSLLTLPRLPVLMKPMDSGMIIAMLLFALRKEVVTNMQQLVCSKCRGHIWQRLR